MKQRKLLLKIFKGAKSYYFLAILSTAISVIFFSITPLILKVTIDSVVGGKEVGSDHFFISWYYNFLTGSKGEKLLISVIFYIALTLLSAQFEYLQSLFSVMSAEYMSKGLRERLYNHIQRLPNKTLSKTQTGDLLQRCTRDVDGITAFFSAHFIKIFKTVILIGSVLYFMLNMDLKMTGVSMSLIPFMLSYCIYFYRTVGKYFEKAEKADSALNGVLQENITGVRVVKAFARQKYEEDKFEKVNRAYMNKDFLVTKAFGQFWTVSECFNVLQLGVVILFGAYFALNGAIEVGVIVAFLSYTGELLWPVTELSMVLAEAGRAKVSIRRVGEILSYKKELIDEDKPEPKLFGDIEFRNVSFSFGGNKVLNNISFKIGKGESLGILGESGSGKTTLVLLLHRIYDDYTGEILVDGIDIKSINRSFLRKNISLILQESFLFNRSIKENINFSNKNYSQDMVEEAAKKASIHNSVVGFDKGYNTLVGESGVTLSGGQKQRVSIARSLIRKNPIIVFDDSLSAVDTETDRKIRERLKRDNPTSIIISHRISTLKEADKIMVLEKGEIKAIGTHSEIKDKNTLYRRILDIQEEVKESFHISIEEADPCLVD